MKNDLLTVPVGPLQIPHLENLGDHLPEIKLSLIIPTYKESENIKELIKKLTNLLDPVLENAYELIVVDDNSPDFTWQVAQSIMPEYPHLRVMCRETERGLSTAVIRGWQVSKGEVLGVIDADLQHPPETLLQMWGEMAKGADLAVASRHVEGGGVSDWSAVRRFLSRGAQTLGLILLPGVIGQVSDPMSGYFMVRREAIADITMNPIGYKILVEVLGRGKVRWIGEVGYVFQERTEGESKVTWKQYVEYVQHLIRLRLSTLPVGRFIRFGLVGLSGVFVDMTMFYVFWSIFHLGLTRSAILSAEFAIFNNFIWNDRWTFGDIARHQKGKRKKFKRFIKFNVICLAGLILNVFIVNFLFNFLHINEYIAKLIAIAFVTVWNFWINLKLSWRVTEVKND